MSDVAFAPRSRAYRIYDFDLPYHIPVFGVGIAISKLKGMGVWDELPPALKQKTKVAKGGWCGLNITRKDLDSIPDHVWETIASELDLGWNYADASRSNRVIQGESSRAAS
jgi:hypothetical protein